jgi:hypothetical protein
MHTINSGGSSLFKLGIIFVALPFIVAAESSSEVSSVDAGRRIYMEGIRPSGELIVGKVSIDVELSGEHVICGNCHRRSGLGSIEGTNVVPPVAGSVLFNDLMLPTSRPPNPPILRPAYTRETLARALREGIGAGGNEFTSLMPRYEFSDGEVDDLISYLNGLKTDPAPGVTETDIHFATIVSDTVPAASQTALLDVMQTYFKQKNSETRYETKRAENGPWHKDSTFKPYRKWVLHVWELSGPPSGWTTQLQSYYDDQPAFAVLNGIVDGSWRSVHNFCEEQKIPCLFPSSNLPVVDESDFYSVYLSKGIGMEASVVAQHFHDLGQQQGCVVQIYKAGDPESETAAHSLQNELGDSVISLKFPEQLAEFRQALESRSNCAPIRMVAWLGADEIQDLVPVMESVGETPPLYLSGTYIKDPSVLPDTLTRENIFLVYSTALPAAIPRLLARSTGWFRVKRIYEPDQEAVQANAFFTLKIAGGALAYIRGYFNREYFLESIEHMIDNSTYTSVYPHMSLAPEQRFVSKGGLIAGFEHADSNELVALTDWLIPGANQ